VEITKFIHSQVLVLSPFLVLVIQLDQTLFLIWLSLVEAEVVQQQVGVELEVLEKVKHQQIVTQHLH
jgi:hypothetical protein